MISKILRALKIQKVKPKQKIKEIINGEDFNIDASNISFTALQITKTLQKNNFEAYIVGGALRDLICQIKPKDFDIATNATPQKIRNLFKRSRIIGRRFPIVHVSMRNETIEVTTFRKDGSEQNSEGRIITDNHFGTLEEDASRRDFTCNALYYNPKNNKIINFYNGIEHILQKKMVMIGDPQIRFKEDPIRIIRAIRLSAKLNFEIDTELLKSMQAHSSLLLKENKTRLLDEIIKILISGHAEKSLIKIQYIDFTELNHPLLNVLQNTQDLHQINFINQALRQTDERLNQHQSISIGFIFACLFWNDVKTIWENQLKINKNINNAIEEAISIQNKKIKNELELPYRFISIMNDIWRLQPRLENIIGKKPLRLLNHPRFRAGYDFFMLRTKFDEAPIELGKWWTEFIELEIEKKYDFLIQYQKSHNIKNSKQRYTRKKRVPQQENKWEASK